ncbi:unnamed protein product [Spirodela intermedia]|uniref:Uncharacterized protein n=1 Tax=Spirodela intermedia TaxID=51605 RepID=A0A7I8LP05_SPIIN|nr:unnamed protein product [Spirodela intermedia]
MSTYTSSKGCKALKVETLRNGVRYDASEFHHKILKPWLRNKLSLDGEELNGGGARVKDFILKSAQQEEALHRIWYALRRWRLVSRRIVLFPTTACSSVNRR